MANVSKPPGLVFILDLINFHIYLPPWDINVAIWTVAHRGDWLRISLSIGDWVETALDLILYPINAALTAIETTYATLGRLAAVAFATLAAARDFATGLLSGVYDYIAQRILEAYFVIVGLLAGLRLDMLGVVLAAASDMRGWVTGFVADAISDMRGWVTGFVADAIGAALIPIRAAINTMSFFQDEISEFFGDPEEYIINKLESALDRFW